MKFKVGHAVKIVNGPLSRNARVVEVNPTNVCVEMDRRRLRFNNEGEQCNPDGMALASSEWRLPEPPKVTQYVLLCSRVSEKGPMVVTAYGDSGRDRLLEMSKKFRGDEDFVELTLYEVKDEIDHWRHPTYEYPLPEGWW